MASRQRMWAGVQVSIASGSGGEAQADGQIEEAAAPESFLSPAEVDRLQSWDKRANNVDAALGNVGHRQVGINDSVAARLAESICTTFRSRSVSPLERFGISCNRTL